MPFCRSDYKPIEGEFKFPENFGLMRGVAKKIAENVGSPFVRVDLYSIGGKIYFSEITFCPCAGVMPFEPEEWDYTFGEWIALTQNINERDI